MALGIVGATRVTAIASLFIVAAVVYSTGQRRRAMQQLAIALGVVILLSAPFYLANPAEFSPLHTASFVRGPAGMALAGLLILLAIAITAWSPTLRRLPDAVRLTWGLAPLSIALTLVPLVLDPSMTTLYISGYAVLALIAPVTVLGLPTARSAPLLVQAEVLRHD